MSAEEVQKGFEAAKKVREKAYAPYSNFLVGAAFKVGKEFYCGFNIENTSYPATICAERSAACHAFVSLQKKPAPDFLVIVTDTEYALGPCGHCLQMLTEFCSPTMPVYMANLEGIKKEAQLKELISFDSEVFKRTLDELK